MRVLFVHPNFPAQFRYVAPRLSACGWRCTFATRNERAPDVCGVERVIYRARFADAVACSRGVSTCLGQWNAAGR
jgi:hypothetical protein